MRICIIGGGPAGLYFAILMKRFDPAHAITLFERDGPDDTFGWGIVFSDQTFSYLEEADAPSCRAIIDSCQNLGQRGHRAPGRKGHDSRQPVLRDREARVLEHPASALP